MNDRVPKRLIELIYNAEDALTVGYRRHRSIPDPAQPPPGGRSREAALRELEQQVLVCTKCPLNEGRTNAVPGMGVIDPLVMVIGEGPGAQEDAQGEPFVGRAGQYLDKWLQAIGLSRRSNVYITNIVKCRPPGNRDPQPGEAAACNPYLERQIDLVRPRAILAVGRISSSLLTGRSDGIGRIRGRVYSYRGIPLVPTYHPSGVLRNDQWRRPVWEDLKLLKSILDRADGHGAVPTDGAAAPAADEGQDEHG
ncbi:MAG: uracil-DNA glycosylase [bacterium]